MKIRYFGTPAIVALAMGLTAAAPPAGPVATPLPGEPTLPIGALDPSFGYVTQEFTVAGTATSYKETAPPDADGRWHVQPGDTAPYVTRIVVVRPSNPAKFNGNVVVEWLNVSGGLDFGPVWNVTRRELARDGSAYVAVSAQRVGIEGGPSFTGAGQSLKKTNPARYGGLSHPGDAWSYDLFSQVGALVKRRGPGSVLGNLVARKVIAVGESQSAGYLTTYVNAVDPIAKVYDGFLIHSRSGGSSALAPGAARPAGAPPAPPRVVKIRSDMRVPVMTFLTETDVLSNGGRNGYSAARQPDTPRLRAWESAGTSHADAYMSKVSALDTGKASIAAMAAEYAPTNDQRGTKLAKPFNNAPQHHYIMESAIAHLERWVANGTPPPHGEPLKLGEGGAPLLDANGNIQGGIRSPWMDVPTERLAGSGNSGSSSAALYGVAEPFDKATLAKLYPGGKPEYLRKFTAALDRAITAGFILAADRKEILELAAASWAG